MPAHLGQTLGQSLLALARGLLLTRRDILALEPGMKTKAMEARLARSPS